MCLLGSVDWDSYFSRFHVEHRARWIGILHVGYGYYISNYGLSIMGLCSSRWHVSEASCSYSGHPICFHGYSDSTCIISWVFGASTSLGASSCTCAHCWQTSRITRTIADNTECRIGSRGVISSPVPHHPAYGSVQGCSNQARAILRRVSTAPAFSSPADERHDAHEQANAE